MKTIKRYAWLSSAAVLAASGAFPAWAQDNQDSSPDAWEQASQAPGEIIVTARKRDERASCN